MITKLVSGSCLILALGAGPAWAGQACMEQRELSDLITRYEQAAAEVKNLKAQVSLYQEADRARKGEIHAGGEYIVSLEHYKELSEQLLAGYELGAKAHAQELADQAATYEGVMGSLRWWRNAGFTTTGLAVAVIIWMAVN
ncbi:MAG: hypothetical protein OEV77_02535 [Nitrospira sp.]|nr:hypothetical protein [Nitrospira sp.]